MKKTFVVALSAVLLLGMGKSRDLSSGNEKTQKLYYPDKSLQAEGPMKDGKKNGTWVFYYQKKKEQKTSLREAQGLFRDGKKEGVWTRYFESGKPMMEGSYEADKQTGPWKYFYESGRVKAEGPFREGQRDGEWVQYDEEGNLMGKMTYVIKEKLVANQKVMVGDVDGVKTMYYKNGKISSQERYNHGTLEGVTEWFYDTGKLKETCQFRNSKRSGAAIEYWPEGAKKAEGAYLDGFKNGSWRHYYASGNIYKAGNYVKVLKERMEKGLEGLKKKKQKDEGAGEEGAEKADTKVKEGDQKKEDYMEISSTDGHWMFYSPEGQVMKEGNYVKGVQTGKWMFYAYPGGTKVLLMKLPLRSDMVSVPQKEIPLTGEELQKAMQEENVRAEREKKKGAPYKKRTKFVRYEPDMTMVCEIFNDKAQLIGKGVMSNRPKAIFEIIKNGSKTGQVSYPEPPFVTEKEGASLRWTGNWEPPQRNGAWTEYFPGTNSVRIQASYIADKPSGAYKEYFQNGKVKAEGSYMIGKKNGEWKVYNADGSLNESESGKFMNDKKFGK
ncbi:MAG: hypothetical protein KA369_03055 [Spirochaetes bacterium]|nr:hypothetical protein [Spirochaetota bacterium]